MRAPASSAIAARLPIAWLILLAWIVGGDYSLLGAWALSEVGAMVPKRQGLRRNRAPRFTGLHKFCGGVDGLDFCLRQRCLHQFVGR